MLSSRAPAGFASLRSSPRPDLVHAPPFLKSTTSCTTQTCVANSRSLPPISSARMPLRDRATAARRHLDRHLFPAAGPGTEVGLTRAQFAAVAAGLLAIAVVLQLARIGWTGSLDALWAEDGP